MMHHAEEGDCVPELNPELSDHGLGRRQIQDAGSSKQQRCPNTHARTLLSLTSPHASPPAETKPDLNHLCDLLLRCQTLPGTSRPIQLPRLATTVDDLSLTTLLLSAHCVCTYRSTVVRGDKRALPRIRFRSLLEIGGSPGHTNAYDRMGLSPFEVVLGLPWDVPKLMNNLPSP